MTHFHALEKWAELVETDFKSKDQILQILNFMMFLTRIECFMALTLFTSIGILIFLENYPILFSRVSLTFTYTQVCSRGVYLTRLLMTLPHTLLFINSWLLFARKSSLEFDKYEKFMCPQWPHTFCIMDVTKLPRVRNE